MHVGTVFLDIRIQARELKEAGCEINWEIDQANSYVKL